MKHKITAAILTLALCAALVGAAVATPRAAAAQTTDGDFIIEWIDNHRGLGVTGNFLVGYTGPGGDVVVPDGVIGITMGVWADSKLIPTFPDKDAITGIYMPDSIELVEFRFEDFKSLKTVRLPREMPWFSTSFKNCSSLENVTMPERMTADGSIGLAGDVFRGTKIKSITIPDGTRYINVTAFWDCPELISVTIPPSVDGIGHVTDKESVDYGATPFNRSGETAKVIIYGEPGSYAESFARDSGIGFNKPYEPPDYSAEADKFIAGLPAYKPVNAAEIRAKAAQLLKEKSAQRVPHASAPLGYITRITSDMTNAERYAAMMRGMRSDPAALEYYSQPDYGFEHGNSSGVNSLVMEKIANNITAGLTTDYEKALAIHTWVADNIYYDHPWARYIEDEKNAPEPKDYAGSPLGVLKLGRTVCMGYSTLTASLLRTIGIPARYVTGNGVPGHAWNEVFADDRWILVDSTWDSGNAWDDGRIVTSEGVKQSLPYFDSSISSFSARHAVGKACPAYTPSFSEFGDFLGIVTVDGNIPHLRSLPDEVIDTFTVPDYITNLGIFRTAATIALRANIKRMVIPNTVKTIGWGSQPPDNYRGVEHVVFDMDEIPYRVGNLWSATELTIGPNVKSVAEEAFTSNFYLETVDFPETLFELNVNAFGNSNIRNVVIRNPDIKLLGIDNFQEGGGIVFYVPGGSETEQSCLDYFGKAYGARVLSLEEQPSAWAKADVYRAKTLGLTPSNLDLASTANITRIEFCRLAVALYEQLKGQPAPLPEYFQTDPLGLHLTSGLNYGFEWDKVFTFTDTSDIDVYKMYKLGVVNGAGKDAAGGNVFNPYDELTREQAAAMISRLSAALGKPLTDSAPDFADNTYISAWATADVGKVQATGIMGGVGGGRFDPQGKYTREQSIVTMLRLMDMSS